MYHVTNPVTVDEIVSRNILTKKQDIEVLRLYELHGPMTATECFNRWTLHFSTPITSIRRSVSDLVNSGYLEYTGELKKGTFKHNCRIAKIKTI